MRQGPGKRLGTRGPLRRRTMAWASALALCAATLGGSTLGAPAMAAVHGPQEAGTPPGAHSPVPQGPGAPLPAPHGPAIQSPQARNVPRGHATQISAPGTIEVWTLPPPGHGVPPVQPVLPQAPHPRALSRTKRAPRPAGTSSLAVSTLGPVSGSGGTSGGGTTNGTGPGLPLMSLNQQVSQFGSSETLVPPDTQLAAGPTDLLEVDNAVLSVWSKSGQLVQAFDLNNFLGVPSEGLGLAAFDPRVAYDAATGRWLVSASATDPSNTYNQVFLAISQTSNPTGAWYVFTINGNNYGELYDQPMFGVSGNKVVISWNDFAYGSFIGAETWVLQKSQLLDGQAASAVQFGPDSTRFRLVPAQNLSSGNTAYMVYNNSDPTSLLQNTPYPSLGVVEITGSPAQGTVRWLEWDPQIAPTSAPPNAAQPGEAMAITTDDDRLESAVWQNGVLWTAGNDACVPAGGTTTQSCLRLIEVSTSGSAPFVLQDFDAGMTGTDLYYPAVSMDSAGNMFVAFSYSSPSLYASVGATGQPAGAPTGTLDPLVSIAQGQGVYCGFDCSGGYGTNRWGDYSAAAQDPSNPSEVWVAGEYAASSTDPGEWGTAAQVLTTATA